ncbi:MAG TPA: methylated-DNA--[protein]-cysteine S-methyltransferase [Dysgonomonas sp.]|uniref:methylated-DNA--[protein]-cysteine S-methyltransferase n=1 Tax=unclassified Dysgonomonas TaxID=2630389 RepID=UPI0025B9CB35|nr:MULTISPECIES: methylated-DNA--[protein]-cysteine S-methyltransferase [unclassified Dysgonomonas]MBS5978992.1 methylated-DNA--[protein]-cysteine S-methyltransferase [Dysgonomonas mossii]HML64843.1 methylated-DNA--[protein]-cysteine S-methyltransferase [Dysgonomonas sp.]
MLNQESLDFNRIKKAIEYISENYKYQPSLDKISEHIHLSPFHFQRLFKEWAGVSPKRFLQYISIQHAKQILRETQATLFDTAFEVGLSGTSRLHDLFINIEGMTPAEYKNEGSYLTINYSFALSPFGKIIVASTPKGICHMSFAEDHKEAIKNLTSIFPKANYQNSADEIQKNAIRIFNLDWESLDKIKLHIKGSDFQLKVWQALLNIPMGQLSSYQNIANLIKSPKASRAVGNAVGQNPVAYLIPCHRIIQSTGALGDYHWGHIRKTSMIGWEAAKVYQ